MSKESFILMFLRIGFIILYSKPDLNKIYQIRHIGDE